MMKGDPLIAAGRFRGGRDTAKGWGEGRKRELDSWVQGLVDDVLSKGPRRRATQGSQNWKTGDRWCGRQMA